MGKKVKMKSKRAAGKRFKRTGGGSFVRPQAMRQHKTGKKRGKHRRRLKGNKVVDKTNEKQMRRLLPYA